MHLITVVLILYVGWPGGYYPEMGDYPAAVRLWGTRNFLFEMRSRLDILLNQITETLLRLGRPRPCLGVEPFQRSK